jgi:TDG/mug DNA glycosylase family protein
MTDSPTTPEPEPILADLLAPDLDVIFVGAAPSHSAAATGHYYAGPTNKFWLLLYQAGFTPRRLHAEEDAEVLRYGIGLTGLYKHTSSSANHLLPPPSEAMRERLRAKLLTNNPRFVCYNGKDVYNLATGRMSVDWGEQEERVGQSRVFVVHSSSARADGWGRERLALYQDLKRLIDATRLLQQASSGDVTDPK